MKPEFRKVKLTVRNIKDKTTFFLFPKPEFAFTDSVKLWFDVNFGDSVYSLQNIEFIEEKKLYRVLYSKTVEGEVQVYAANENAAKAKAENYLDYIGTPAYDVLHVIETKG